jgi:hypothetical protein
MPQERIAAPSIWTVQAPHCAMPHPYLVPVRPTFSRIDADRFAVDREVCHRVPLVSSIHRMNFAAMFGLKSGTVQIKILRLRTGR